MKIRSLLFTALFLTQMISGFTHIRFLHIPKCAGLTMHSLLESNFESSEIYPYKYLGNPYKWQSALLGNSPEEPMGAVLNDYPDIKEELVRGHFPYWFLLRKDPNLDTSFIFTILRRPAQRVLSQFRFWNQFPGARVASPLDVPPNTMCKMLCSDPTLKGQALLQDAITTLRRLDFVIFMDDYDNGVRELFKKIGLSFSFKEVPKQNTTKVEPVSDELIADIRQMNNLDVQLYLYAEAHCIGNKIY